MTLHPLTFVPTHHIATSTLQLTAMVHSPGRSAPSDAMAPQANALEKPRTAATTVLEIPELLEMILLQLPCLDIFVLQRVSSFWQGIIDGSVSPRTALFLQPAKCTINIMPGAKLAEVKDGGPSHPSWNQYEVIRAVPDRNASAARMLEHLAGTRDYAYLNPFVASVLPKRLQRITWESGTRLYPDLYIREKFALLRTDIAQPPSDCIKVPTGLCNTAPLCSPPLERINLTVCHQVLTEGSLLCFLHDSELCAIEHDFVTLGDFASFVKVPREQIYTETPRSSNSEDENQEQLSFSFLRCQDKLLELARRAEGSFDRDYQ